MIPAMSKANMIHRQLDTAKALVARVQTHLCHRPHTSDEEDLVKAVHHLVSAVDTLHETVKTLSAEVQPLR